ncbi:MAG TPA: hypothetical protein C5S51_01705 [Methanosarcinaceae archaeon]|nr:hypothetical protein [Methanosarcinaceae archaeon]
MKNIEANRKEIKLENHLSLRDSANYFFDKLDTYKSNEIMLDFSGVQTISRSFAQQFLARIDSSNKTIVCINQPNNIKMMFEIVVANGDKPIVVSKNKLTPINISTIVN